MLARERPNSTFEHRVAMPACAKERRRLSYWSRAVSSGLEGYAVGKGERLGPAAKGTPLAKVSAWAPANGYVDRFGANYGRNALSAAA